MSRAAACCWPMAAGRPGIRGAARRARLPARGITAVTIDQRGHGDSDWIKTGEYSFEWFAEDMLCVLDAVAPPDRLRAGGGGRIAGRAGRAVCRLAARMGAEAMSALVLVDITPKMRVDGVARHHRVHAGARRGGLRHGGGGSGRHIGLSAAPAQADQPVRPVEEPAQDADGRYRWHWDPNSSLPAKTLPNMRHEVERKGFEAAARLKMPVLLVSGRESELVGEDEVDAFVEAVPHAKFADIAGARHMVAGDRNDVFTDALLTFFDDLTWR